LAAGQRSARGELHDVRRRLAYYQKAYREGFHAVEGPLTARIFTRVISESTNQPDRASRAKQAVR
jgi:hypothetical protein